MSLVSRFFLVIEGTNNTYPNYTNATIRFLASDPAEHKLPESFISSPLFSLSEQRQIPDLDRVTSITFLMVPKIFPNIAELFRGHMAEDVWFSLGLANIVIFEYENVRTFSDQIIKKLTLSQNITGYEIWHIQNKKIVTTPSRTIKVLNKDDKASPKCGTKMSSKMPLYLKFAVSEFILSVNKLLKASKKFTPYYYEKHCRIIAVIGEFCDDLAYLSGDKKFDPSHLTLAYFKASNKIDLNRKLKNKSLEAKIQETINDRHGKIIQFNSSLSYIYSQAYSGTFPIFDHVGIVRRHSLLGLGSAVSALYELMIQLEGAFNQIPFEDLLTSAYYKKSCPKEYLDLIVEPTQFDPTRWRKDPLRAEIAEAELFSVGYEMEPADYYNRLSFFSGRLGFREYEFGATAAIQVTVESHTLPWHVINYTHEIIHSHVRYLLRQLYMIPNSARKETQDKFLSDYLNKISKLYKDYSLIEKKLELTYYEYFVIVLLKFIINARIFGSLSRKSNIEAITKLHARSIKSIPDDLPSPATLLDESLEYNKDITEIFVHIIDYNYIYKQQIDIYAMSIWTSWSTIPAVANDLSHYILRTLIIIALNSNDTPENRFIEAKDRLKQLIVEMRTSHSNVIFENIFKLLNDSEQVDDLQYRFINCIIIGDLVNNFFVAKLETYLDNADPNIIYGGLIEEGIPVSYSINTNSFAGEAIKSKARFLLDQLGREIFKKTELTSDDIQERTSAWLLLSLSSFNSHD